MMKISVCIGSACHVKGSYNVINSLQQLSEEYGLTEKVDVCGIFCLGHCAEAVAVQIDDKEILSVTGETARDFFIEHVLSKLEAVQK